MSDPNPPAPPPVPPPEPDDPPPPPAVERKWSFPRMPPIFYIVWIEYIRILLYSIPPTLIYIVLEPLLRFPVYPAIPCPSFMILGLLSILSCFFFGDGEIDGYFYQPPTTFDKGIRLVAVKVLELCVEYSAYRIFATYQIRDPFFKLHFSLEKILMTAVGMYLLTVFAIAALRTFLIFPWIVLALRWTFKVPCWFPKS